ncbi:YqaA family protein [Varunaivibrio sulfuroxidans]|uniref:Membrane protein YqaA with SNARE-associated domain n=1 Tax=Varunaivibrio sulfuroxidans TaxID=1773489 RepID=A0A4R3JIA7_9PROT|nr:YqaA family protein [Varunaivibrio sulfuroxidans]TCS64996.1 membrane protein YqaA with SNARE-associated domain [Varunaivibrio sulfuroxidans]WES29714.1 DedA family protein [Varunaivibrio sulfuroxidans]
MIDYGGLFLAAFLAATLVPFSSEAILAAMFAAGRYDPLWLWAVASTANILGALVNWGLGRYLIRFQDRRWFPFKARERIKAERWFARYGVWSLLLSWVPVTGDPITFAAGLLRVELWRFMILVTLAKAGRYAVVLFIVYGAT